MDNGPIGVVEYIGQGYADMAQTPEGVASIAGEVSSLVVGGFAGKALKTNISPKKAEVKPVEGGSKTISQADRMKLDNGDYTLNDELYLKYRDVYDKPMYYDQTTDKIHWPVDDGLKASSKIEKEIPKNTIFERYGENSGEHLGKVTEPHETRTVPHSEKAKIKAVETSYGKSSVKLLNGTENFTDSAIEHIFEGNVKRGKAGGYHYEGIEDTAGTIIPGTEVSVNSSGVYKAQVEVNGIAKTANGGYSTFFPKSMNPQDVIDTINEAYGTRVFVEGTRNTYRGYAGNGLEIEMYIDQNGKIISAFPKE